MGPLAILLVGVLVALWLAMWLRTRPRSRPAGRRLGPRAPREILQEREALEAEDLAQLLEAYNARRRRRGLAERSADEIELLIAADVADRRRHAREPGTAPDT